MARKPVLTKGKPDAHAAIDPANFIREARKSKGLSLMEAAALVGVSHQAWQQWEKKGNLQVSQLPQVAAALGLSPAELVPGRQDLTFDERAVLMGFRAASERDRRTILRLIGDLTEPPPAPIEVRRPTPAVRAARGKS